MKQNEKKEISATNGEREIEKPRREFIKKAAYRAPVFTILGKLMTPTKARADTGSPDGPPGWGGF